MNRNEVGPHICQPSELHIVVAMIMYLYTYTHLLARICMCIYNAFVYMCSKRPPTTSLLFPQRSLIEKTAAARQL